LMSTTYIGVRPRWCPRLTLTPVNHRRVKVPMAGDIAAEAASERQNKS
jgi:hypothetical protein